MYSKREESLTESLWGSPMSQARECQCVNIVTHSKTQVNLKRQVHTVPEKDTTRKTAAWKDKVTMTINARAGV